VGVVAGRLGSMTTLTRMDEGSRHRQFEDQFQRQLRNRARALIGGVLPADRVLIESMPDGVDTVRATLARLERYDRDLLERLPGTQSSQLRFQRRVLGGLFSRDVARVRAQVLAPLEALLTERPPAPVGREQVLDALARYELLPRRERPSAAVFASPTGFTPEALALVGAPGGVNVILVSPRDDGGWDVQVPSGLRRTPWARLLEFESLDDRLARLQYHLEKSAALLDSRGLSLAHVAEKLGLPRPQTEELLRRACRADSRLMTVVEEGQVYVCRSPLGEESHAMSIWSRIRRWLRLKPTAAQRVRELTGQRRSLEQQRYELDRRIAEQEAQEREALAQGATARSDAERKQVAGRLMRVRRDLRRVRSQATVFTQQIDILGTHIHNLTLAEQGRRTELPSGDELARQAAEAEQVVSELAANAELAAGIEVGAPTPAMEAEEAAILAEFEQVAQHAAQTKAATAGPAEEREPAAAARAVPPAKPSAEKAGPEPG